MKTDSPSNQPAPLNGIVLIDKPAGCTSHDVVNRWRRLANTKRVGHLGTLDPMATGLLVLVTGAATRLSQFFTTHEKTYRAEITLGCHSDTYDREGEVIHTGIPVPLPGAIVDALQNFRGKFAQTPPPVSAKKVKGVAAYKLARQNIALDLRPVAVDVKHLEIERLENGILQIAVTCSAGTYIRSIAHDLGERLGCGGLLSALRRTQSGEFSIQQARTLPELETLASAGRLEDALIPASQMLPRFPSEHVSAAIELQIRQGRDFRTSPFVVPPGTPFVKALSYSGELIAIGQLKFPNFYHPAVVL